MNNILPTDETSSAISKMHELNVTYRGTGKSVLFLHGLLASRSYWGRVIEGLDALKYATYTFDLLGFGDSPKPKTATYDVDTQVDNVYAYIKKNKLKSFTLVGHSMGSLVAIRFAVKYPELVNKLILCNTPLFTDGQDIRQVIAASNIAPRLMVEGKFARILCVTARHIPYVDVLLRYYPHRLPSDIKADFLNHTWNSYSKSLKNLIMAYDPVPDMKKLKMPVFALLGGKDKITSPFVASAKLPANVATKVVPNADHHLPVFHSNEVVNKIQG